MCLSARTVPLRIAYTLAISLLLLAAPAAAKTDALLAPDNTLAAATWSGQWASEWGTMRVTQSGARVEGPIHMTRATLPAASPATSSPAAGTRPRREPGLETPAWSS